MSVRRIVLFAATGLGLLVGVLAIWIWSSGIWELFAPIDTSDIETQFTDVAYASTSETQTLDVYLPNEGEGPFPVIIAIHGGGFMSGNSRSRDIADAFEGLDRGYAVVSVNYRLSGEATFPAAVTDVRAAVRFLKANGDQYDLDTSRLAVWGASAGGNLASMVGTTPTTAALDGDTAENLAFDSSVQAVVNFFGPIDFLTMDEQFSTLGIEPALGATDRDDSPESRYLGQIITADPKLTSRANPASYLDSLDPGLAPAFFIQHGTDDANVPILQSADFAAALVAALGEDKVTYRTIEGAGHGTDEFSTPENLDLVFSFLDTALDVALDADTQGGG